MRFPTEMASSFGSGTDLVFKGFRQRQKSAPKETKPEYLEVHDENQARKQDC